MEVFLFLKQIKTVVVFVLMPRANPGGGEGLLLGVNGHVKTI
jgi:hypothetical protein